MAQHKTIYLDYAAATPMLDEVIEAMKPYSKTYFYNPSATYLAAKKVGQDIESARSKVAHWLGARSSEIVFTAGGTEANNLAIHGIMKRYPKANIVISAIEHESIIAPAALYECRIVSVLSDGRINLEELEKNIDDNTVLVSIMYANNEIGTIQPIRDISRIVAKKRALRGVDELPLYLHTDACQATNYLDLHVARLGVDLMSINGGKIYGPKQSGVLYVKAGASLKPMIEGGGQEHGLRSGTENVSAIIGLATALDIVQSDRQDELKVKLIPELRELFFAELEQKIPKAVINGSRKYRLSNNIHFTIPNTDNERVLMELDENGIQAAAGSACNASDETPSHVLRAIGLTDSDAQSSYRMTIGRYTTKEEIKATLLALQRIISK